MTAHTTRPPATADLINLIRQIAVKRGEFTLASGQKSDWYADMRLVTMHPQTVQGITNVLVNVAKRCMVTHIGGPAAGAIPLVASAVHEASRRGWALQGLWVRRTAKDHGTQKLIEGVEPGALSGCPVLIVEDVATTGGSALEAVNAVRAAGGVVQHAFALLDREQGAAEMLIQHNVKLLSLTTARELRGD